MLIKLIMKEGGRGRRREGGEKKVGMERGVKGNGGKKEKEKCGQRKNPQF